MQGTRFGEAPNCTTPTSSPIAKRSQRNDKGHPVGCLFFRLRNRLSSDEVCAYEGVFSQVRASRASQDNVLLAIICACKDHPQRVNHPMQWRLHENRL